MKSTMKHLMMAVAVSSLIVGSVAEAHDEHSHGAAKKAAEAAEGKDGGHHHNHESDGDKGSDSTGEASTAVLGPNEGKILSEIIPHAEIFVTEDRMIQLTFLSDDGEVVAPGEQSIVVYCGERTDPTKMAFEKTETAFVSDKPLPEGMNIPTVLQVKMTPDSEKQTVRINLNLATCSDCERAEYTCLCHPVEHSHGPGGHSHSHDGKSHTH